MTEVAVAPTEKEAQYPDDATMNGVNGVTGVTAGALWAPPAASSAVEQYAEYPAIRLSAVCMIFSLF